MIGSTEQPGFSFFSAFQILPAVKTSIVIPVKDEEAYILKALTSFSLQVDIFGKPMDPVQFEILVLANNCSDQSVEIIKKFQLENPTLNIYLQEVTLAPDQANIGYVRRKLMDCAHTRLCKNGGGIIMTTDGDTTVAPDWISQTKWEIDNGAEAVGGRIVLSKDELEDLDEFTRLHYFKDEKYQLLIAELEGTIINSVFDPAPRHHQHFSGSFAITTDCYSRSGGIPVVKYLEDCAFFERLETVDARIRHSHKVKVSTSARCIGRTEVGLSYQLNVWKNLGKNVDDYQVESCESIVHRLTQKKNLMTLWEMKDQPDFDFYQMMGESAPEIIVDEEIETSFNNSLYFGEWFEKILRKEQGNYKDKFPYVPIGNSIRDLKIKIKEYSSYNLAQTSIL